MSAPEAPSPRPQVAVELRAISEDIAGAIQRRDIARLELLLAPGFVHRTHGGEASDAAAFLRAIADIPGEIVFVRLEDVQVDWSPTGALVTGIQHAQVVVNGEAIEDRRAFVDWFIPYAGEWRIQAAVDLGL
jgi:hypothetical protein